MQKSASDLLAFISLTVAQVRIFFSMRFFHLEGLGHTYSNSQAFNFMREDLLQSYLRKNKLSLIWVVWGERETSAHLALRRRKDEERFGSGLFQAVIQYC